MLTNDPVDRWCLKAGTVISMLLRLLMKDRNQTAKTKRYQQTLAFSDGLLIDKRPFQDDKIFEKKLPF